MNLSFEEFAKLSKNNRLVCNHSELLSDIDTPVSIYAKLRKHSPQAFLFESVTGGEKLGRYSFIGFKALKVISSPESQNSYEELRKELSENPCADNETLAFFHKGFVGYFSFESIQSIEPSLNIRKAYLYPQMYMLLVGSMVVLDHIEQKLYLINNSLLDPAKTTSREYLLDEYNQSQAELANIKKIIFEESPLERIKLDKQVDIDFVSNTGEAEFMRMVDKAKEHILEGDIFQIVLSHKLSADIAVDPLKVYRILRTVNPSPYLFIFNICPGNLQDPSLCLVGSSPEILVKCSKDSGSPDLTAELRPIAGTYKRGNSDAEDEELSQKLINDPKEKAEHLMLIDLARNDLGRVCQKGSIKLAQNMIVEKYSHVLHIVSSVTGLLDKNFCPESVDLLKASFPAGTLSGAPKIEAVKIIGQLEKETRGPYGGCIGYIGLDGTMDMAITIRTIFIEPTRVTIQAGAGIVADSDRSMEYQETLNKAEALIKVLRLSAE
jgi:anthranilate synthase component 1